MKIKWVVRVYANVGWYGWAAGPSAAYGASARLGGEPYIFDTREDAEACAAGWTQLYQHQTAKLWPRRVPSDWQRPTQNTSWWNQPITISQTLRSERYAIDPITGVWTITIR